ncbi:hypothetical protein [Shewanella saliphila]|uniref:Sulfotransferase domain-containing protein n=1 Tax=Shewanella saliphila TaxID=2282698 RepID=A0ABQ2Q718_9GAMM|nr:hypothetical protein [Shewanella saliphila]MCL1101340.1 hypothetical protein [Shewanella saliphila]GGP50237.1 hypothetical protein GCM10009409_15900 [Shewanella saliphila]
MKRKLFLHVGPHKTGTTLIQKVFLDNQSEILGNGLLYPKNYIRIFGHHHFRDLIKDRALSQSDHDFFKDINSNVLLSSEDFISFSVDDFKYLRDSFEDFDINIIYSWRRSSLKMYSIWQEIVKHGQSISFFDFYHEHLAKPGQSYMLSADLQVSRFVNLFGKSHVHLIDYDKSCADKNLLELFFSIVECEYKPSYLDGSKNKMSSNVSLSPYDTEIIRVLNALMAEKYNLVGNVVRETYLENYSDLDSDMMSNLTGIMKNSMIELPVGDYFIDKRVEKIMTEKFIDRFINYDKKSYKSIVNIVRDNWLLNQNSFALLNQLATQLNEKVKYD